MQFTHQQIKEIIFTLSQEEDGFSKVMELVLESLMHNERNLHNENTLDVSNGFRERRYYYGGKMLTLSVPRSRHHHFYPFLLSVLKNQEEEYKRLVSLLYTRGLTGEELGEVFEQLYGRHYSKSHISRLMQDTRSDVFGWLNRRLERFYPVIYIDAVYIYA